MKLASARRGSAASSEHRQVFHGLMGEHGRLPARALDPEERDEGRLAGLHILARRLANGLRIALDVEKIVDDLKRQTEVVRVGAQRVTVAVAPLAEDRAGLARERDQRAGLHPLHPRHFGHAEGPVLGEKIEHLPSDHAINTGSAGKLHDEIGAHPRIGVSGRHRPEPRTRGSAARRRREWPSPRRT